MCQLGFLTFPIVLEFSSCSPPPLPPPPPNPPWNTKPWNLRLKSKDRGSYARRETAAIRGKKDADNTRKYFVNHSFGGFFQMGVISAFPPPPLGGRLEVVSSFRFGDG